MRAILKNMSILQIPFSLFEWLSWPTSNAYGGLRRKKFRGVQGRGSGPVRGPGSGAPRTPENFRKFAKNSRRKLQKMLYFRLFWKKFRNHALNFGAVGRKPQLFWENLRKFWNFLMKIQWKNWILSIFENLLLKIKT